MTALPTDWWADQHRKWDDDCQLDRRPRLVGADMPIPSLRGHMAVAVAPARRGLRRGYLWRVYSRTGRPAVTVSGWARRYGDALRAADAAATAVWTAPT